MVQPLLKEKLESIHCFPTTEEYLSNERVSHIYTQKVNRWETKQIKRLGSCLVNTAYKRAQATNFTYLALIGKKS